MDFRDVSIRIKIAVLTCAVVALVVFGQSFQSLANEAVITQESIVLRARIILVSTAGAIGSSWNGDSKPDLSRFRARIQRQLDVRFLALIDDEGEIIVSDGEPPTKAEIKRVTRLRLRTVPRSLLGLTIEPLELIVATPVILGEQVRAYLLCGFRSTELAEKLKGVLFGAILSAAVWLALGAALTLAVTGRFTRPLVRLARDLSKLGASDYAPNPSERAEGEIGIVQDRLVDLSKHLRAERQQVSELTQALRHQVEVVSADLAAVASQQEAILNAVRDAILLVRADGRVTVANHVARRLFGEGLIDSSEPIWSRVADPPALEAVLAKARELRSPMMAHAERRPEDAAKEPVYLRVRIDPLADSGEVQDALVMVAENISETRALQEQMQRSERLAAIGTLTGGLAHQIGNHLSAIKGYAALLTRRLKGSDPQVDEDLLSIDKEVRSAVELMDKVFMMSRTRPPREVPMNVPSVVREAVDLVRVPARRQGIALEEDYAEPGCSVQGDPHLLAQAVLNILVNALQAMPGGGKLRISSACRDPGHCAVLIADDGPGMAPEVVAHIFDPFFTTKPEGEGTGLGLAIAHRVVELHGGVLRVSSRPGEGSTFELDLPVKLESSCRPGSGVGKAGERPKREDAHEPR